MTRHLALLTTEPGATRAPAQPARSPDTAPRHRSHPAHPVRPPLVGAARPAPTVQPKLMVGPPSDRYEREADRVAHQVIRGAPVERPGRAPIEPTLQRRDERNGGVDGAVEDGIRRTRGEGRPLPDEVRTRLEDALGADFSSVRVHTGAGADALSRSIQARAFTTGRDLYFRRGTYQPHTRYGQELLAHELTHVVQQTGPSGQHAPPPAVQRVFEVTSTNFWDYVGDQATKQSQGKQAINAGVAQGTIEPFTTVGFEAEFAQTEDSDSNPLKGTSHLELAEAPLPEMKYTGINFKLETDADRAVELVTPPFLLPTVLSRPIPDPVHLGKIDTMMRDALETLAARSKTLDGLAAGFKAKGIDFTLRNVTVGAHHLSYRNVGKFDESHAGIDATTLSAVKVVPSKKGGGITTQANIATDLETFHNLAATNRHKRVSSLDDGADGTAQFAYLRDQIEERIDHYIDRSLRDRNLDMFKDVLARNLAGQFAVGAIDLASDTQERLFKDRSKQEAAIGLGQRNHNDYDVFRLSTLISSHVKDIDDVWLKDTLFNVATDLFKDTSKQSTRECLAALLALSRDAQFHQSLKNLRILDVKSGPSVTQNVARKWNAQLKGFLDIAIEQMSGALDELERHLTALAGNRVIGMRGPTSDHPVPFMSHDPHLVTPRQDTLVPHDKAQIPYWMPLYVTELRRQPVDMLTKLTMSEGGHRWKFVKRLARSLKYETKVYAATKNGRFRYITFSDLLKCWKEPFGEQYDITDQAVAEKLLADDAHWAVTPTEVDSTAALTGHKIRMN